MELDQVYIIEGKKTGRIFSFRPEGKLGNGFTGIRSFQSTAMVKEVSTDDYIIHGREILRDEFYIGRRYRIFNKIGLDRHTFKVLQKTSHGFLIEYLDFEYAGRTTVYDHNTLNDVFHSYFMVEVTGASQTEPKQSECDCGGFKTYGSMEPHYHSGWCTPMQKRQA